MNSDSEEEIKKEKIREYEHFLDLDAEHIRSLDKIDWSEDEDERMSREILHFPDPANRVETLLNRHEVPMEERDSLCLLFQQIAKSRYANGQSSVDIDDIQISSFVCLKALREFLTLMETPSRKLCIDLWHDANHFRKDKAEFRD